MLETSELKDGIYMAKVVGEKELYKIKIAHIRKNSSRRVSG
ncbi:hypothetical protein [Enterococcus mundtii]